MSNTIKFELANHLGDIPKRATEHSVGYDFVCPYNITIQPNERVVIDTGIKCSFPSYMWLGVYGRSSFVKKGLVNPLGVGVVDHDYYSTGNSIGVALWNISDEPITIEAGTAVGQGVFHHVITAGDTVDTQRTGGFGSTDKLETIVFLGKEYPTKRAILHLEEEKLHGVVIPFVSNKYFKDNTIMYDYTFINDVDSHLKLHDGDDPDYNNRCWWVKDSDVNLTIE